MEKPLFTGVCTALVTPFLHEHINYPMLEQLIHRQIEHGIEAIVICGTTGESATLSDREKFELIRQAVKYASGRCRIIAGTGSNDTLHALELSIAAQELGADGLLLVSPYYNKATPEGLISHYSKIAEGVHIPCILYNVPSRTGVDIPVSVYSTLSKLPNIAGVKEASTDIVKIARIRAACPASFSVWSGNDDMAVPVISLGGQGVISVLSNILPTETELMVRAALDGDFDTASALQINLLPMIQALFREVNPIPVKKALKIIGYDCGQCRLPLTEADANTHSSIISALKDWFQIDVS